MIDLTETESLILSLAVSHKDFCCIFGEAKNIKACRSLERKGLGWVKFTPNQSGLAVGK